MIRRQLQRPSALSYRRLTLDRKRNQGRREQTRTARAERTYVRSLKDVGRQVGQIINGFEPGDIAAFPSLEQLLQRYAEALTPWAERTAGQMLHEVNARDRESWRALGNAISKQLHSDLLSAPIGGVMRALLDEQVGYITSIPLEAAQRVHELTLKGLESGTRAREYVEEIQRSGDVAESRAILIARDGVSRTAGVLTRTRSLHAGLSQYFWRTAGDQDVRPGHKAMSGKVCDFANPPAVDEGGRIMHFHPGEIWSCRCYAEPIIPDD